MTITVSKGEFNWSTHPGEHLREYMEVRGISVEDLALSTDLSAYEISRICDREDPITKEFAAQLEDIFGLKEYIWLGLQDAWDRNPTQKQISEYIDSTEKNNPSVKGK